MPSDPLISLLETWKSATETYLATWNRTLEAMANLPVVEAEDWLGTRHKKQRAGALEAGDVTGDVTLETVIELTRLVDQLLRLESRLASVEDQLSDDTDADDDRGAVLNEQFELENDDDAPQTPVATETGPTDGLPDAHALPKKKRRSITPAKAKKKGSKPGKKGKHKKKRG